LSQAYPQGALLSLRSAETDAKARDRRHRAAERRKLRFWDWGAHPADMPANSFTISALGMTGMILTANF